MPHKIPPEDLDAVFHQEMKAFFARPERLAEHLISANKNLPEKEALLATHEREIRQIRNQMTRTRELYLARQVTTQGFGQFYKPAEEWLNLLTTELPKLEAEVDFLKMNRLTADEILLEANTLYDRWPILSVKEKRRIAESFGRKDRRRHRRDRHNFLVPPYF